METTSTVPDWVIYVIIVVFVILVVGLIIGIATGYIKIEEVIEGFLRQLRF